MPRVNYANSNDLIKSLFNLQAQKMMADLSLERQLEYLERSNALYGQRESERIQQTGAKEKEVALYKHGLGMAELAKKNAYWMAQQPGVKRLMNMYQTTDDPNVRTQIEGALDKFSTLFGTMAEKSLKGDAPGADEMGAIATFVDPKEAITYFNGISANVRGHRTADIQQQQADTQRTRAEAAIEGGGKAGKAGKDLNDTLAARATEAMAYLTGEGEGKGTLNDAFSGKDPKAELGKLRRMVSKIKSMAGQKKFKDQAIAQSYFDFLDAIYENPAAATEMLKDIQATKDVNVGLGKERIKRANLPAGTRVAVNDETGEVIADIGGKWVPVE